VVCQNHGVYLPAFINTLIHSMFFDSLFLLRLVISFLVASVFIGITTLLAERFGSKIGGLITNLPSNILISLLFIAIINGEAYVVNAIPTIPLGLAIDVVFLFVLIITMRYNFTLAIILSLLTWFLASWLVIKIDYTNLIVNSMVFIVVAISTFILLEKHFNIRSVSKSDKKYTIAQIVVRGMAGGFVVATVIVLSRVFESYIIGVLSTFPAVILTTMVILKINQSTQFAQATGKILIISISNILVYGCGVYFLYPVAGVAWGTLLSFFAAFIWIWALFPLMRRVR